MDNSNSTINSTFTPTNQSTQTTRAPFVYALYSSSAKIIGFTIAYSLISLISLIGNFMVILVVVLNKNMHTATNVLLLNLSISDCAMVIFGVPALLQSEIVNRRWVLGKSLAKITQTFITLSAAAAIFTMMAIALERYFAVVHPLKQIGRKKKSTIITAIIIIWSSALAICLPSFITLDVATRAVYPLLSSGTVSQEVVIVEFTYVDMSIESYKIYAIVVFVVLNVIPIVVLSYFYVRIVWRLWNPDRQLTAQPGRKENSFVARARRHTTTMLIVVLVVFVVLMFPFNISNLISASVPPESLDTKVKGTTDAILKLLVVLNTATNPIIYNFLSNKFRTGFRNIFSCRCKSSASVEPITDAETIIT